MSKIDDLMNFPLCCFYFHFLAKRAPILNIMILTILTGSAVGTTHTVIANVKDAFYFVAN
jgi:hypothetical protein